MLKSKKIDEDKKNKNSIERELATFHTIFGFGFVLHEMYT